MRCLDGNHLLPKPGNTLYTPPTSSRTYNLAFTLLSRSTTGSLFIPIRAMQYLAILDAEEFVFLDGERKCWIDIAWRNFQPPVTDFAGRSGSI